MWDCVNAMDEEIVLVLHPETISVFIIFSPLTLSPLLCHSRKLPWVAKEQGK